MAVNSGNTKSLSAFKGTGSPESVVTAPIGSIFQRTDVGSGLSLYIKESGAGNTGWRAISPIKAVSTKTGAYTIAVTDYTILADAASAGFTVTLPAAASASGLIFVIKKIDVTGNVVTVDGNGAEVIDGSATQTLDAQWESMIIQSNGTAWYILGAY